MAVASLSLHADRAQAAVKVKKITIKSNYGQKVHVGVGRTVKLTTRVTVSPNSTANQRVTYSSSNVKIAKVTSAGAVKGVSVGTCKVTAKSKINSAKKASITVKVVKAATQLTFPESSGYLYAGDILTLKKMVAPSSGSYKTFEWSSSNEKVATVNTAGRIKAVAAGTATITAKAVDGSGVSSKYKLKVLTADAINIESTEILSAHVIRVRLDKAKELTAGQFVLDGKRYNNGNFIHKYTVKRLRNYDNKTYDITISDDYTIEEDSYVRVQIADLPGNGDKSKTAQAVFVNSGTPPTLNWLFTTGEEVEKTVDISDYCVGNIAYSVTGSVEGLSSRVSDNKLIFSGKFDKADTGTDLLIDAIDEMGNTASQVVHVYVADADTVTVAADEDVMLLTGINTDKVAFAMANGGSGSYRFSADGLPPGIYMSEDGTLNGTASGTGEYIVKVTAADKEDASKTAQVTASLRVSDPRKIVGKVTAADGTAVSGAVIHCVNVTDHAKFDAVSGEDGTYSIYVEEGSYDITAGTDGAEDKVYNLTVSSGGRTLDFILSAISN